MINDEMFFAGRWVLAEAWRFDGRYREEIVPVREISFNFLPCGVVEKYARKLLVSEMDFDYFPQTKKLFFHMSEEEFGNEQDMIEHDVEIIGSDEVRLTIWYRTGHEKPWESLKGEFLIKRTEPVSTDTPGYTANPAS